MLEPLPTELVVIIFKLAVEMFRFTDRETVVHLATVSKMAYDLVTPMLYNTVIFKKSTIASLRAFKQGSPALAKRIFAHTRAIHIVERDSELPLFPRFFTSLEQLHAGWPATNNFAWRSSPFILRRITLAFGYLLDLTYGSLPPEAYRIITHVTGRYTLNNCDQGMIMYRDPRIWMKQCAEQFTALTHLGVVVGVWTETLETFDRALFQGVIKEALRIPGLQQLAFRICGTYPKMHWHEIKGILRTIADPRLRIWCDGRSMVSETDFVQYDLDDVSEGRSIWTETVQL